MFHDACKPHFVDTKFSSTVKDNEEKKKRSEMLKRTF